MMKFKNQHGMTLVEALVAAAISIVGASLCFFFIQNVRTHKSGVDGSLMVKEVLADNVVEVKGTTIIDLPEPGQCKRRLYTDKKEFISEETLNTVPCPTPEIALNQMMIAWEVALPTAINATFSISSMKLPTASTSLKQVTVHSWGHTDPGKSNLSHNQIVIFRK